MLKHDGINVQKLNTIYAAIETIIGKPGLFKTKGGRDSDVVAAIQAIADNYGSPFSAWLGTLAPGHSSYTKKPPKNLPERFFECIFTHGRFETAIGTNHKMLSNFFQFLNDHGGLNAAVNALCGIYRQGDCRSTRHAIDALEALTARDWTATQGCTDAARAQNSARQLLFDHYAKLVNTALTDNNVTAETEYNLAQLRQHAKNLNLATDQARQKQFNSLERRYAIYNLANQGITESSFMELYQGVECDEIVTATTIQMYERAIKYGTLLKGAGALSSENEDKLVLLQGVRNTLLQALLNTVVDRMQATIENGGIYSPTDMDIANLKQLLSYWPTIKEINDSDGNQEKLKTLCTALGTALNQAESTLQENAAAINELAELFGGAGPSQASTTETRRENARTMLEEIFNCQDVDGTIKTLVASSLANFFRQIPNVDEKYPTYRDVFSYSLKKGHETREEVIVESAQFVRRGGKRVKLTKEEQEMRKAHQAMKKAQQELDALNKEVNSLCCPDAMKNATDALVVAWREFKPIKDFYHDRSTLQKYVVALKKQMDDIRSDRVDIIGQSEELQRINKEYRDLLQLQTETEQAIDTLKKDMISILKAVSVKTYNLAMPRGSEITVPPTKLEKAGWKTRIARFFRFPFGWGRKAAADLQFRNKVITIYISDVEASEKVKKLVKVFNARYRLDQQGYTTVVERGLEGNRQRMTVTLEELERVNAEIKRMDVELNQAASPEKLAQAQEDIDKRVREHRADIQTQMDQREGSINEIKKIFVEFVQSALRDGAQTFIDGDPKFQELLKRADALIARINKMISDNAQALTLLPQCGLLSEQLKRLEGKIQCYITTIRQRAACQIRLVARDMWQESQLLLPETAPAAAEAGDNDDDDQTPVAVALRIVNAGPETAISSCDEKIAEANKLVVAAGGEKKEVDSSKGKDLSVVSPDDFGAHCCLTSTVN